MRCLVLLSVLFVAFIGVNCQNPCSASKMWEAYRQMRAVNCRNCDLYFHCIGNYKAVYECSGVLRSQTATAISNIREWYQGFASGQNSDADQAANAYGRSGGCCSCRYLSRVKCAYSPSTKKCGK